MDNIQAKRQYIKDMLESPGGQILMAEIDSRIVEGWDKFISLPVLEKTGKAAFDSQAKYKVLKDLKDWIETESRMA